MIEIMYAQCREGIVTMTFYKGQLAHIQYGHYQCLTDVSAIRRYIYFLSCVEFEAEKFYKQATLLPPQRSAKVQRFWHWLCGLPEEKYQRAQRLCQTILGGLVRGIISKGNDYFLIVLPNSN